MTGEPSVFNATEYLLATGELDHPAVITPDRTLTYAELAEQVDTVAAALRGLGVRQEERVLMCLPDDIELFVTILAVMRIGAVAVPASTMLTGGELRTMVTDSRARVIFGDERFLDALRIAVTDAPDLHQVVLTGDATLDLRIEVLDWQRFLRLSDGRDGHRQRTWADTQALWLYTSGTTGTPKAAMHRHADIAVVAENYGKRVLGITAQDRCLSVAKLFFAYGIGNSLFFPLAAGATALLEPARPTPQVLAARAKRDGATLLFGTPSFWGPLSASAVDPTAFSTVRQGISAGEALPGRIFERMRDRFAIEVLDGIGSTELLHIFLSNMPGRVHPGSSGVPVPGYEIELRDPAGALVAGSGVAGELYVRGDSAAIGYWCRASVSRQVFLGEWTRTGDSYVRNDDGTFTCLGRFNDLLKAGGIWVSPAEVEDRLLAHPAVAEVAVVAVPDSDELDKPVACVVPVAGANIDSEELIRWCREELAAFKRPRAVLQLDELPKTATGKIRRNVLRDLAGPALADLPHADKVG
jgi:benzoate-CoA ligase